MALIDAKGIAIGYGAAPVLAGVDFTIERGEIVTLIGPNGSGKSTLIKALMGALPVSAGRVARAPGLSIGYVPQRLMVDRTLPMTARRFLDLPNRKPAQAIADAAAQTGIALVLDHQIADLSGGQFQRVLLARAVLARPDILILDEPTQGLDQPGTAVFYTLLETLRRDHGCAILLVSHDLHVVMSASDRVICLNGHVCCEGTPHVVQNAPEYRALFGEGTRGTMALYRHHHDHAHAQMPHDHGSAE